MSNMLEQARAFFDACETGQGWDACKAYCHPDATFSAQADALADVSTVEGYCEWMKGLFTPIPDGRYELKFFAADEAELADTVALAGTGGCLGYATDGLCGGVPITAFHIEFDTWHNADIGDPKHGNNHNRNSGGGRSVDAHPSEPSTHILALPCRRDASSSDVKR